MYKRIIVTGGNGFIGFNFIHYMMSNHPDLQIVNIDKKTGSELVSKNYHFINDDICNIHKIKNIGKIDCIVHFAAESHVDKSISDARDFIKSNIVGTYELLEFARKHEIRFHHVSTDEVFGSIQEGFFDENSSYNPLNPYSASKASSDHLVRSYYNTYGLPVTITNCSNNYGPFQLIEKFIPLAITNVLRGFEIPVYGDGKNIRDWIHVKDHCRALEIIIEKGKIGETYCVGGDCEKQNIEIAEKICQILGEKNMIDFVEDRKGHDRRYAVNHKKITEELGWTPQIDFDSGLYQTVQWYKDNSKWWR
jgi:dTDP-glucose 4,6-dehydratase